MLSVCPVIDAIVEIYIETGMARRGSWRDDYCLDDDPLHPGIGAGRALGYDGNDVWMWGISGRSTQDNDAGRKSFAQLYKFFSPDDPTCVELIGSPVIYGQTTDERMAELSDLQAY